MATFGFKKKQKQIVGEMRKSKITTSAGCGALVDFPGFSGLIGGQNLWDPKFSSEMKIQEKTLEDFLNKEFFVQVAAETDKEFYKNAYSIPILRFPEMYYCPDCYELDYASRLARNYQQDNQQMKPLECNHCGKTLLPSRFIVGCGKGHLNEFPYDWWVHRNKKERCENPKLKIYNTASSGGLESLMVECETCKAKQSMANVLSKETMSSLKCRGGLPWLGKGKKCECESGIRAMMRGSNNVYYPDTVSALTIPPWSSAVQKMIEDKMETFQDFISSLIDGDDRSMFDRAIKNFFQKKNIQEEYDCSYEEFVNQINMRFFGEKEISDKNDILYNEYKALVGPDKNDPYFKTETEEVPDSIKEYIDCVKLVKRLREVQVLRGFRRIEMEGKERLEYASMSTKPEKWLPAVELLGEGIFIKLSRERVKTWLEENKFSYEELHARYDREHFGTIRGEKFSPVTVLVHTFSHLLMRELSFASGYDASSIKEKIYVSTDEDQWMCGVLLYTASANSDGSLGGLVRQGKIEYLMDTIMSMLEKAEWCSNDPVCMESEGQGWAALNIAACHACCLVPEISCQYNNCLLDRNAVVGEGLDGRAKGYFVQ